MLFPSISDWSSRNDIPLCVCILTCRWDRTVRMQFLQDACRRKARICYFRRTWTVQYPLSNKQYFLLSSELDYTSLTCLDGIFDKAHEWWNTYKARNSHNCWYLAFCLLLAIFMFLYDTIQRLLSRQQDIWSYRRYLCNHLQRNHLTRLLCIIHDDVLLVQSESLDFLL